MRGNLKNGSCDSAYANIDPTSAERTEPIVINHDPVVLQASLVFSAKALARQQRQEAIRNVGTIAPVDSGQTSKTTPKQDRVFRFC